MKENTRSNLALRLREYLNFTRLLKIIDYPSGIFCLIGAKLGKLPPGSVTSFENRESSFGWRCRGFGEDTSGLLVAGAYRHKEREGKSETETKRRARVCSAAVCRAHSRDLQLMKLGCSRVACQINMSLLHPLPPLSQPSSSPKPIPRASSAERELPRFPVRVRLCKRDSSSRLPSFRRRVASWMNRRSV